jgi:hypothetical protein
MEKKAVIERLTALLHKFSSPNTRVCSISLALILMLMFSLFVPFSLADSISNSVILSNGNILYPQANGSINVKFYWSLRELDQYSAPYGGSPISNNPNPYAIEIANHSPTAILTYFRWFDFDDPLATLGDVNVTPEILNLFHSKGTEVWAYIPTGWANSPDYFGDDYPVPRKRSEIPTIKALIDDAANRGADGFFIDEVCTFYETGSELTRITDYYTEIRNYIKNTYGNDKIVIFNVGTSYVYEPIMNCNPDVICVENDWIRFRSLEWKQRYPKERFMAYSVREDITVQQAVDETFEAWNDYTWFFSVPHFWHWSYMKPWYEPTDGTSEFDQYMSQVGY